MPTPELTIQRKTDDGYPLAASLTRPGGQGSRRDSRC